MLTYIVTIFILLSHDVWSQFHVYYMDQTNDTGLYHDCLYFKQLKHQSVYNTTEHNFKNQYQIIPYCLRPFSQNYDRIIEGKVSSRVTFEELRKKQVTTRDLLTWSASIDLIEHYDAYLNLSSNVSARLDLFYNCSSPWFGTFCQYTFNTNLSFNLIVNLTFHRTHTVDIKNMTCYIDLICDRGPAPACLDWREICDGKIDCIGTGIDELNCFQLEVNECEENEFRCHNGLCISEEFFDEGPQYPDCLDGTDDDVHTIYINIGYIPYFSCHKDPGFWCEETDFTKRSRFFVCGDGQRSGYSVLHIPSVGSRMICSHRRDETMKNALLSFVDDSDFSYDCWFFLHCTTIHYFELNCEQLCDDSDERECYINMKNKCHADLVIFPQRPVLQGHVLFVYLTNKTIFFVNEETSIFPDYICYDTKRCPFLPNISSLNINGTTCRLAEELGLHEAIDILRLFQACLTGFDSESDIQRAQASLFHCPGTTKYISKHRVLDSVVDCYNGTDESNVDACQWNHKHRFKCSSENKCISHVSLRNLVKDCVGGEDELPVGHGQINFQQLCNGYVHMPSLLIDGFNETDETHCDHWPCNNIYTQCDGAWNCINGVDELNCIHSKCPLNTHECVSPQTKQVICLPLHSAGNGIVDCLGSTDERAHCRLQKQPFGLTPYRCWNDTFCVNSITICLDSVCWHENKKECSDDVKLVFTRLNDDRNLQFLVYKYFMLDSPIAKVSRLNATTSTSASSLVNSIIEQTNVNTPSKIDFRPPDICNRGILIYVGLQLTKHCLCPPSYFGDRCQYQSQRVSLILQFSRICIQECLGVFGILITLIDQNNIIHAHEQLTYVTTHQCENKFYIYLLYQSRSKNVTNNYNIHIDAYNKINLTYHSSWILPIKFIFLPVNKIAVHLIIPAYPSSLSSHCSMFCGHGQCFRYVNSRDGYFCHCDSGWSGVNCTITNNCDCSPDSRCVGHKNNQSVCFCSLRNYGPHCRLQSVCQNETCKNGGQCIPDDERVSRNTFICLCPTGFSGPTCEVQQSKIHISFDDIEIPRTLLIHFITVRTEDNPMRTTMSIKIPYDQDATTVHMSVLFHMIFLQISSEYFLGYVKTNYTSSSLITIPMKLEQRCLHTQQLFSNETMSSYPLLRRVKFYHLLCKQQSQLECFHDNETFMCLCTKERHANCFPFDFNTKYTCNGLGDCQNDAQCFSDRQNCPYSVYCVCADCFYGSKCQFTTNGFGLSLDAILGYQIRPRLSINRQPFIVKVSIALTVIMLVVGLINSALSIITFRRKILAESGCRYYLLATSIASLCTSVLFSIKLLMLILSQMSLIPNIMVLRISCISIDFLLRLGPIIADWLNACVAIDRSLTVVMGINFDKTKSKRAVRWVLIGIPLISAGSILHDPIHRQLIFDQEEERRWCLVQYSSPVENYNSAINIIHFSFPFMINLLAAIIIIIVAARKRSTARHQQSYQQHLNEQFHQHKHLIISSLSLVLLATPRLIISFMSGCMKSARNPTLYLAGYFISFIPPSLTFIVFVIPSKLYKKEFYAATTRLRTILSRQ